MTLPSSSVIEAVSTWSTVVGLIFVGLLGQRNAKRANKTAKEAKDTALKVSSDFEAASVEVAKTLAESESRRDESLRQIHALVNGAMGNVLRKVKDQAAIIAEMTGKPEHIAAARSAQEEYDSHIARQAMIDRVAQQIAAENAANQPS